MVSKLSEILNGRQKQLFDDAAGTRPAQPALIKFPIGSLEGLECALRELAWMKATQAREQAQLDKDNAARKQRMVERLVLWVGKKSVTFDDRRDAIEREAKRFFMRYRKNLLDKGAKSRKVTHGEFGTRWKDASVELIDDKSGGPGKWFDKLVELLLKLLAASKGLFGKSAAFIAPHPTVNRTKLLEAYEAGQVTDAQLRQLGYKYVAGREEFFIRPTAPKVESSSAEKPAHG